MHEGSLSTMPPRAARAAVVAAATLLAAVAAGCGEPSTSRAAAAQADGIAPEPRTLVAVVDFSGSQTSHSIGAARGYLEKVVADLDYGDRLVLLEMFRTGSRDSVATFVQDMPRPMRSDAVTSYDRRELDAARRGVLNALPIFFDPEHARSVPTTDLFTTLHIAAEHLRDAGHRRRELLLLSDMLQSTPAFEFEAARRMPPSGWVTTQQEQQMLPLLDGTCVVVIGADHTTPPGQRVRHFWTEFFDAAGADLDAGNYRLRAPPDIVDC